MRALSLPIGGQGMNAGLHDAGRDRMAARRGASAGQAASVVLESTMPSVAASTPGSARQAKGFRRTVYRGPVTDAPSGGGQGGARIGLCSRVRDCAAAFGQLPEEPAQRGPPFGCDPPPPARTGAGERAPEAEGTVEGRTTSLFPFIYNRTA